ncbi:MAG: stage II sporulation protein M [Cyclobacteriaceae bacterium]
MREAVFVKLNGEKWKEIERYVLSAIQKDPDKLAGYYIQLTDDLAFSRTQYPDSHVTNYLNSIASRVHHQIYINKQESSARMITFWTREVPLVMYEMRKQMIIALTVFLISILIGVVSTRNDENFSRLILGDSYIDMTLSNIEKGDPMGVYASMSQVPMFLMITVNNIKVSFVAYIAGLLFSIGAGLVLVYNGVMLGTFQYFFYQKGLLLFSFLSIWIHGTIEITSIVIAGGAGIFLGNSFMFPGTLPRGESFVLGAKKSLKIIIGLVPLFITAGLLESFVTRYSHWPAFVKLSIILVSLFFIIYYFGILPVRIYRKTHEQQV